MLAHRRLKLIWQNIFVRGLGYIKKVEDIEGSVIRGKSIMFQ